MADTSSDWEKLTNAISPLLTIFTSSSSSSTTTTDHDHDVVSYLGFGINNMPTAHKYGIFFGCLVFLGTITTVLILLILGGTFRRIVQQQQALSSSSGSLGSLSSVASSRLERHLLLEWLLEARDRMLNDHYNNNNNNKKKNPIKKKEVKKNDESKDNNNADNNDDEWMTPLTKMLCNVAPSASSSASSSSILSINNISTTKTKKQQNAIDTSKQQQQKNKEEKNEYFIPEGYEENYIFAYRRCLDRPGGPILPGLPEARFEAYARAYAGCGPFTSTSYRRSYARMYETQACRTNATVRMFEQQFHNHPEDIVGRTVRLQPLCTNSHAQSFFDITCGNAYDDRAPYDPNEVWAFLEMGPFRSVHDLCSSSIFSKNNNNNNDDDERKASFAILGADSNHLLGIIQLTNDDPHNLSIQLNPPIMKPSLTSSSSSSSDGSSSIEQLESCFLLLDRLFANGYRRISMIIDTRDIISKKLPIRLGFTQEGMLPRYRIIKDANSDVNVYGLLNSDWQPTTSMKQQQQQGSGTARSALFQKLHGIKAEKADASYNAKEMELEIQQIFLATEKEKKKKKEEEVETTEEELKKKKE